MNILFIADYYLPHMGGSRVYYHHLYKHLAGDFSDHITVLTKKVAGWREFDQKESNDSFRILRGSKPLPDWKLQQYPKVVFPFGAAARHVLKHKVDLVHAGDLFPPGIVSLWLKKLFHIPYVAYSHGEEITQADRYRYQPVIRDRIYQGAAAVVANAEFARQNLIRIGIPDSKIYKINPGVDWERFLPRQADPELLEKYHLQGKKVLLTVSRLYPRKGHDTTIKAIAKIAQDAPELRYLIVGCGPEEQRLRKLVAELGLSDVVIFAGYVPEDQLSRYYDVCDLFVMPNREHAGDVEGFGMVFLEAGAAGKAVIGGRSGGTIDAIVHGTTGLLVNPKDEHDLAQALTLLLNNDDLRNRLGAAGLRRARTEFDWATRARLLREVSADVVDRAPGGGAQVTRPSGAPKQKNIA